MKKLINFEIIKKMHRKNIFLRNIGYIIFSFFIVALLLAIGIYLGYTNRPEVDKVTSVINKDATMEFSADFNTFWKVWNVLNEKSIYAGDTDDQDKVWGAISGLASSFGDPYSPFFPPEENDTFREEIRGTFEGIGAEIGVKDDALTIVAPLKDTPAWNSV
jgi:carboxyl-terminal processing protease